MNPRFRKFNSPTARFFITVFVVLTGIGLLLSSSRANAQLSSAAINGTVRDATGAVVPGAQVKLKATSTGTERTTQSNSVGNYAFIDVAPGSYAMEVTRQGFSTMQQNSFVLYVNQTATFNFSLAVGTQVQRVTVAAASAQLETSTANLGTVINQTEVTSLPLNGRNFTQLLTLSPGSSRAREYRMRELESRRSGTCGASQASEKLTCAAKSPSLASAAGLPTNPLHS